MKNTPINTPHSHPDTRPEVPTSCMEPLHFLEKPRESWPMNGRGGLYMQILKQSQVALRTLYPQLEEEAAKHGYDPKGCVTVGLPCAYGLGTDTISIWFHDKLKR